MNDRNNWGHDTGTTGDTILISIQQIDVASPTKKARVAFRQRALLLAKRTRARGARADAFASRLRGDAKDGRSVASRVDAIGSGDASFAQTGRRGTRFSRESGHWPPTTLSNIEKSVSAPRRLSTMTCLAPFCAKNSVMTLPGADSNLVMSALP